MNQMFKSASKFNQDISKWDISNVTDMEEMFYLNFVFNRNINTSVQERLIDKNNPNGGTEKYLAWDTRNVTNMKGMFRGSSSGEDKFNGDISNWNTSNVTTMEQMFNYAQSFNKQIGEKVVQLKDSEGKDFGDPYTAWDLQSISNLTLSLIHI